MQIFISLHYLVKKKREIFNKKKKKLYDRKITCNNCRTNIKLLKNKYFMYMKYYVYITIKNLKHTYIHNSRNGHTK